MKFVLSGSDLGYHKLFYLFKIVALLEVSQLLNWKRIRLINIKDVARMTMSNEEINDSI